MNPDLEPLMSTTYKLNSVNIYMTSLDNNEPASVTALAVSRDHKTVYVGDDRGRVFSWMVSNKPGKGFVDHWVQDGVADTCLACGIRFTIYERKHHCRSCGKVFCSSCSKYQIEIPELKISRPVRVCGSCFAVRQQK